MIFRSILEYADITVFHYSQTNLLNLYIPQQFSIASEVQIQGFNNNVSNQHFNWPDISNDGAILRV